MKKYAFFIAIAFCAIFKAGHAAEIGHYEAGVYDIRDFFVPDQPGFYGLVYNYYYMTDRLNDGSGNKINSVSVNTPLGPARVGVDVSLNTYATIPMLMWVAPKDVLCAKFGAYISPSFENNSLDSKLTLLNRTGGTVQNAPFAPGDLFVQPVWLDWGWPHWDCSIAYGFYAPVGKYSTETVPLPGGGAVTVDSKDNIGLGYWTQQVQGGVAWYPMTNKATAVTAALTYDYNGVKRDFELKPGQMLTLNWGISQYLPLSKSQHLLLEVGPAGYDGWQITESTGNDAVLSGARSQVHAVGGQIGLTYVPWNAFLTAHGFYEYMAENRFQGASIGINLGIKF